MKKFVSIALIASMTLAITACSSKEEAPADTTNTENTENTETTDVATDETPDAEGSLLVWLDNEDWANAVIAGFNEKYPNVEVTYEIVGSVDTRAKVELDGPSGIGPDVYVTPHDGMSLIINDGLAEAVPTQYADVYNNTIIKSSLETTMGADGNYYGTPISTESIALFWNKDLYGETAPETFEEIMEFAKTYNNPAENKYAFKWQVNDAYHNFFFLSAFGYELFGPEHDDYRLINLETPEAAAGMEYHTSWKQYLDLNTADLGWDTTVAEFQAGTVPFTVTGPWAIADAVNNGVNFGVTKLPTINGNQPTTFSGNQVAVVSAYSENKDLAFLFTDFLASVEGATITYNVTGKLPAFTDSSSVPGLSEDEYLMGIMEQAQYTIPMPTIPEMASAWVPLEEIHTFTWNGDLSIEEAQAKATESYELLLNVQGKSMND